MKEMENSRINDRAVSNTTATDTAVTTTPTPRIFDTDSSCGWWCERQINKTFISKKASTKRQIDLAASEASESS